VDDEREAREQALDELERANKALDLDLRAAELERPGCDELEVVRHLLELLAGGEVELAPVKKGRQVLARSLGDLFRESEAQEPARAVAVDGVALERGRLTLRAHVAVFFGEQGARAHRDGAVRRRGLAEEHVIDDGDEERIAGGRGEDLEAGHALRAAPAEGEERALEGNLPFKASGLLAPARRAELNAELGAVIGTLVCKRGRHLHEGLRARLALALHVGVGRVRLDEAAVAAGGVRDQHLDDEVIHDRG